MCGTSNRVELERNNTLEDCQASCTKDRNCTAIEYWPGNTTACYKCLNPDQTSDYLSTNGSSLPPSVYLKKGDFLSNVINALS